MTPATPEPASSNGLPPVFGRARQAELKSGFDASVSVLSTALSMLDRIDAGVSPALPLCTQALRRLLESVTAPTRVSIMGEYNSGKTSVANLILGAPLLPTSPIANTKVPVFARFAEVPRVEADTGSARYDIDPADPPNRPDHERLRKLVVNVPLALLHEFELMDTPSTSAIDEAAGWAEIFIWCTLASRAWGESERRTWTALPARCRARAILAATHADALSDAGQIARVRSRLTAEAGGHFQTIAMVDATGGHEQPGPPDPAGRIDDLPGIVSLTVAAHRSRRARTANRIARRVARLTLRHLDPAFDRTSGLPVWEEAAGRLRRTLRSKPRGDAMRHELRTPNAVDTINRFEGEVAPALRQTPDLGRRLIERASARGTFLAAESALDDMAAILNLVAQDVPAGFGKDGQPERMDACRALIPMLLLDE